MNNNVKSATTAGLLGIFLGGFGAHNWYLGQKKQGTIHVCLAASGLVVSILASVVLPSVLSFRALLSWATMLSILGGLAMLIMGGNAIWGFVEGIIILTQGDVGLARKGYMVVQPVNNYGGYNANMPQNNMGNMNMGGNMNGDMNSGMNQGMGNMNMGNQNMSNGQNMNNMNGNGGNQNG